MANKTKKTSNENILYIQDSDAQVLGIIEGSAQKVYIDNREVDVVFVDEHEVIPASAEEKKLYQEAHKIASNYTSAYLGNEYPTNRTIAGYKNNGNDESSIGTSNESKMQRRKNRLAEKRAAKLNEQRNLAKAAQSGAFSTQNEAFTREELDIVKDILSSKKGAPKKSDDALVTSKALTPAVKKTAVATKTSVPAVKKSAVTSKALTTTKKTAPSNNKKTQAKKK